MIAPFKIEEAGAKQSHDISYAQIRPASHF